MEPVLLVFQEGLDSGFWAGDKVRIRHRLDLMVLEVFSHLNNSGILYLQEVYRVYIDGFISI